MGYLFWGIIGLIILPIVFIAGLIYDLLKVRLYIKYKKLTNRMV